MSSLVNKVKEALHSDKDKTTTHDTHHQTHDTHGTHGTSTTHHAEPRVHDTTTTGVAGGAPGTHDTFTTSDNYTHGSTGTTGHTGGAAFSGDNRGTDGPAPKTDGPHKSDMLNKVDPRVDSDRDHSKNMGMNPHGTATVGAASNVKDHPGHTVGGERSAFGNTGVATGGAANTAAFDRGTTGPATRTDGPHSSNVMNTADPRVDSDRDGSRNMGMAGGMGTTGTTHTTSTSTSTAGPHSSNIMNKADPRVDSDRDGSRNMGMNPHGAAGTATTGTAGQDPAFFGGGAARNVDAAGNGGTFGNTGRDPIAPGGAGAGIGAGVGTAGHHNDRNLHTMGGTTGATGTTGTTGTHGVHGTTHGVHGADTTTHGTTAQGAHLSHGAAPGPAPNTAGPHKSDMLNKVDPRVDSNLDGSKTVGGDKTYAAPQ